MGSLTNFPEITQLVSENKIHTFTVSFFLCSHVQVFNFAVFNL